MAKKTGFDFPEGMDPTKYLEQIKTMAEDGLQQSKKAYDDAQKAMEEAKKDAEDGLNTAQAHASKISMATLESVKSNTEFALSHMEKLSGVKSVSEFMELQSGFMRQQAENATQTAKSMQALYQDAATDAVEPAKKAAEKAMEALKPKK